MSRTLLVGLFLSITAPTFAQTDASTPESSTSESPASDSSTFGDRDAFFVPNLRHLGETPAPPFGAIFRSLGGDFKRLPSKNNALWLGIGAGLAALAAPSDARVSRSLHSFRGSEEVFEPGANLGSIFVTMGSAFGTYAVGRLAGSSKTAAVGADLIRAQIIAQSTTQLLKRTVGRTRPNGDSGSFPSGHASTSFATATVLQKHYGWRVGIPAYAIASYVGVSRIQSGKHYTSDVLFGAALGIVAGRTVTLGGAKLEVAPLVTPGGGVGVGFSLTGR